MSTSIFHFLHNSQSSHNNLNGLVFRILIDCSDLIYNMASLLVLVYPWYVNIVDLLASQSYFLIV